MDTVQLIKMGTSYPYFRKLLIQFPNLLRYGIYLMKIIIDTVLHIKNEIKKYDIILKNLYCCAILLMVICSHHRRTIFMIYNFNRL